MKKYGKGLEGPLKKIALCGQSFNLLQNTGKNSEEALSNYFLFYH